MAKIPAPPPGSPAARAFAGHSHADGKPGCKCALASCAHCRRDHSPDGCRRCACRGFL